MNKKNPLKSTDFRGFWSEWGDSNARSLEPKPMSEPSVRTLVPSLALSVAPTVPLWNSIGLFISATAFGFWDLYGMEFCILKVLPTRFTSDSRCFLPQGAVQKLRRINKEITAGEQKSIPAVILCQFIIQNLSSGKDITNLKIGFSIDKLKLLC